MKKKYLNTTIPAGDATDFEISDDEAPGTLHWGNQNERESFSTELKDFHECILDVLTASIAEEKMEEIWFKAALRSYDIPQKFYLNKKINIMIIIWEEFAKIGDDSEVPSHHDTTWQDFDLQQNWKLLKVDLNVTGYLLQYPENLTKVIDFFLSKLPKFTDWRVMEKEVIIFKENMETPLKEGYHPSKRVSTIHDHRLKWELFCVTIDKVFDKYKSMGMFRSLKSDMERTISLKRSLRNLESPTKTSDPESSDDPMP